MIFEDACQHLEARGSGDKREFRCPAHDDTKASARIRRGDKRWFVDCYANQGCDEASILSAAQLGPDDVWYEQRRDGHEPEAIYHYADEHGKPQYEIGRFVDPVTGKKTFKARLPGASDWAGGIGRMRRVLYRLPQVLAALAAGRLVWIVEGEKDVHALEAAGEVATTMPFGAGKWRDEFSAVLAGAGVVLVVDKDKAGRSHARAVKASLEAVEATVYAVEARTGKDASDHLGAGLRLGEFVAVELATPEVGEPAPLLNGHRSAKDRIIDMRLAMLQADDPLPYRMHPLVVDGTVTVLAGRRAEHKSWLAIIGCAGVHRGIGQPPLGCESGVGVYVDGEMGSKQMARRYRLLGLTHDAFITADGFGLRLPRDMEVIRDLVTITGARLLVLDSFRRLAPDAKEDKSDDVTPVMVALAELARATDVAVLLIHHRSVKAGSPDTRGSSAIEDQADAVWVLEKVAGDPDHRTRRRLRNTKQRLDGEFDPLWIDFKIVAGVMTMGEAEPFEKSDDSGGGESIATYLKRRIEMLREQVAAADGGWPMARLAAAVGRSTEDYSFKAARDGLVAEGSWAVTGRTVDRRMYPVDSGGSGVPLGDRPTAGVENGSAPQNAIFDEEG